MTAPRIGVRWTVGDVSPRGFEALRLSIWGAWRIFGPSASYAVCVNTIGTETARGRTGAVPDAVAWRDSSRELPGFLARAFADNMAEGVAWKLAPLRLFPDAHEISLDNDCILWELPPSMARWLEAADDPAGCLMAEDVRACHGRFAAQCPSEAVNAGIRGLPPGFDLADALRAALDDCDRDPDGGLRLRSELDEQGLQAAALSRASPLRLVRLDEVTICSPFHPHLPGLGACGAHFVGLNARHIRWDYYGRPADEYMAEHWARHRPALLARTGAPEESGAASDALVHRPSAPDASRPARRVPAAPISRASLLPRLSTRRQPT